MNWSSKVVKEEMNKRIQLLSKKEQKTRKVINCKKKCFERDLHMKNGGKDQQNH